MDSASKRQQKKRDKVRHNVKNTSWRQDIYCAIKMCVIMLKRYGLYVMIYQKVRHNVKKYIRYKYVITSTSTSWRQNKYVITSKSTAVVGLSYYFSV